MVELSSPRFHRHRRGSALLFRGELLSTARTSRPRPQGSSYIRTPTLHSASAAAQFGSLGTPAIAMVSIQADQRLRICPEYHWARGVLGAVSHRPLREVTSLGGVITYAWVIFDESQIDLDGRGPYAEAEIDVHFLSCV